MSVIKKDGAIYGENNEYYGELIHFEQIDCSGENKEIGRAHV